MRRLCSIIAAHHYAIAERARVSLFCVLGQKLVLQRVLGGWEPGVPGVLGFRLHCLAPESLEGCLAVKQIHYLNIKQVCDWADEQPYRQHNPSEQYLHQDFYQSLVVLLNIFCVSKVNHESLDLKQTDNAQEPYL